jgi:hypothetical protein
MDRMESARIGLLRSLVATQTRVVVLLPGAVGAPKLWVSLICASIGIRIA